jgi:hypothetical protein
VTEPDADARADERFERSLLWRELLIALVIAAVLILRELLL